MAKSDSAQGEGKSADGSVNPTASPLAAPASGPMVAAFPFAPAGQLGAAKPMAGDDVAAAAAGSGLAAGRCSSSSGGSAEQQGDGGLLDSAIEVLRAELAKEKQKQEKLALAKELDEIKKANEKAAKAAEGALLQQRLQDQMVAAEKARAEEAAKQRAVAAKQAAESALKAAEDKKIQERQDKQLADDKALQARIAKADEVLKKAETAKKWYEDEVNKMQQQLQQRRGDPTEAGGSADSASHSWRGQFYGSGWKGGAGQGKWSSKDEAWDDAKGSSGWEAGNWEDPPSQLASRGPKDIRSVLGSITAAARYPDAALRRKAKCIILGGRTWVSLADVATWSGYSLEEVERSITDRGRQGRQGRPGYFYTIGLFPDGTSYASVSEGEERGELHVHALGRLGKQLHSLEDLDASAAKRQKQELQSFRKAVLAWHADDTGKSLILWYGADVLGGHQHWPLASAKAGFPSAAQAPPPPRGASRTAPVAEEVSDEDSSSRIHADKKTMQAVRAAAGKQVGRSHQTSKGRHVSPRSLSEPRAKKEKHRSSPVRAAPEPQGRPQGKDLRDRSRQHRVEDKHRDRGEHHGQQREPGKASKEDKRPREGKAKEDRKSSKKHKAPDGDVHRRKEAGKKRAAAPPSTAAKAASRPAKKTKKAEASSSY
jgi:hypothetical protein